LVYGICTYLCLFSNKFVTFLDFNWCFFFICLAYPKKLSAYECGFDPLDDAKGHFDIRFYLVSILFIIFDLEVTFLFPWTISLNKIGLFGFWSMIVFLLILTIGFIYEWKKGTLDCE
jgi:NADH:ubiquinone oxidoreductase subunit 3 (subunit A)